MNRRLITLRSLGLTLCALMTIHAGWSRAEDMRGLKIRRVLGEPSEKKLPRYHAVIVAINDYAQWNDLVYPERDARRVADILRESYAFESVDEFYGEKATLKALRRELRDLARKSTPNDAILFFTQETILTVFCAFLLMK